MESFTTAPSSLESMDLDHVMNLDYLALDSDSSSLNSWEIEPEYYEHEVKKMIYKKRAAMRQYEEGPRRKNGIHSGSNVSSTINFSSSPIIRGSFLDAITSQSSISALDSASDSDHTVYATLKPLLSCAVPHRISTPARSQ
ncbi:hypothetical protein SOVF_127190, partial [Spinacia oleracea]